MPSANKRWLVTGCLAAYTAEAPRALRVGLDERLATDIVVMLFGHDVLPQPRRRGRLKWAVFPCAPNDQWAHKDTLPSGHTARMMPADEMATMRWWADSRLVLLSGVPGNGQRPGVSDLRCHVG